MYIPCRYYSVNSETILMTKNLSLTNSLNLLLITVLVHTEAICGAIWIQRGVIFSVCGDAYHTCQDILKSNQPFCDYKLKKSCSFLQEQLTGVTNTCTLGSKSLLSYQNYITSTAAIIYSAYW